MKPHRTTKVWYLSLLLALLSVCQPAIAQESETNGEDSAAAIERVPDRTQTIYVPFSKLQAVFEREGRGVFLPYDQFEKLWNAARRQEYTPTESAPPVDSIITSATNEATIQKDVVQVEATLTIELLKQGWNRVPLRLADAAIQSATIDGEVARVTPAADGGYQLLVENPNQESTRIEMKLVYARAYSKSPGQNSVGFSAPQAPVNRWRIRIPQSGVKVNVQPMIAATEANGPVDSGDNDPDSPQADSGETELLAFVGAAPQVTIRWTPRAEGATGLTAITSVRAQQEIFLGEGAVRTRATLQYQISRAQLSQLTVDVPADHKVVNVFDPNVRKWDVSQQAEEGEEPLQRISVELFEPAGAAQNLTIELEKFIDDVDQKDLPIPSIRAVGVGRQQGIIVVQVDPSLRAESTKRTGLLQMDASELPGDLANQNWSFAYRYASLPFELAVSVEKIQPRIRVQQLVEFYVEPQQLAMDVLAVYQIEQAGLFQLELNVPAGFEVLQVRGREAAGAAAVAVDTFHLEGDSNERLIVNLASKALGRVALLVQLRQQISDPNLLTPTGSASTFSLAIPIASQQHLSRLGGKVVVHAPESLRLNPTTTTGLRAVSFSEAYQSVPSCRDDQFASTRPTLAFAFSDQPTQLDLAVRRRKSYVTARQRLVVRLDSGVVRYETRIVYDILYSGVKSLRIDVPAQYAADIRNTTQKIRELAMEPPPADVAAGYVAWSLTGETELLGQHIVNLTWERKIDELDVGKSLEIDVPRLIPIGTDRAWGQIIITKTESLDVEPSGELDGLRPIDPVHDVMPDAAIAGAARALEFYDDWTLKLTATRYQLEEVKRTSIERGLVRAVITRSNHQGVQALYRVQSARQRLAIQLPDEAQFDSQPARVNGQPVSLERGDQDLLYVPLVGQEPNSSFVLELRYTLPGDHRQIDVPEFPEDPAVQKVYLAAFLPEELSLLSSSGPWTEEFSWRREGAFKWVPDVQRSDDQLAQWVTEDIAVAGGPAFQTDGVLHLFSALRPQPPPEGSLRLKGLRQNVLAGLVFALLAIVGLVFLRSSFMVKLVAIAILLIAAVGCGVFTPTLAQQLTNLPTYAGLAVIGIAWSTWYAAQGVRQFQRAPSPPDREASGTPEAPAKPQDAMTQENATQENATQENATQENATQENATQENAEQESTEQKTSNQESEQRSVDPGDPNTGQPKEDEADD